MSRPDPQIKPRSFDSSVLEVTLFNPALVPPSALTPGLTPFPDSKNSPSTFSSSGRRPWVVSPPPPAGLKTKVGDAGGASSGCGWLKRNASARGVPSVFLALLLAGVLFVVSLGVRVITDATHCSCFDCGALSGTRWKKGAFLDRPTHSKQS